MRRPVRLALVLFVAVPACGGSPSAHSGVSPPASSPASLTCSGFTLGPGDYERTLVSGGRSRSYFLHVPPDYRPTTRTPLVLSFHGGGGNAGQHEQTVQLEAKAGAAGFLLVTPQGTGRADLLTWNAGNCCGYARDHAVDDVAFVRALLDAVSAEVCVDPKRAYATGFSNGGLLSHRLGCELSDRIAAVAPVGGGLGYLDLDRDPPGVLFECRPPRPVPVLHIHGLQDGCYPFEGGVGYGISTETKLSIPATMAIWRERNACQATTRVTYTNREAECRAYQGCRADTRLCTIRDGGHAWPGSRQRTSFGTLLCGGVVSQDLRANDVIWDFFAAHPMP